LQGDHAATSIKLLVLILFCFIGKREGKQNVGKKKGRIKRKNEKLDKKI
jgi:hypothetical protein